MDDLTLQMVTDELRAKLIGRSVGRVFQLAKLTLVIEFRIDGADEAVEKNLAVPHSLFLLIAAEPAAARLYLTRRYARQLETEALALSAFAALVRKQLAVARLTEIEKLIAERIVRFRFQVETDAGARTERTLIAQLTGRSSDVLLLDETDIVIASWRLTESATQKVYQPPSSLNRVASPLQPARPSLAATLAGFAENPSETLEKHFAQLERERRFDALAARLRTTLNKELTRRRHLIENLERDLAAHGEAERHKRLGDLILANIATAERHGRQVKLVDYYAEEAPLIEIEVDENTTLQEEAARRFALFGKAKRAGKTAALRLDDVRRGLANLERTHTELENQIAPRDLSQLEAFAVQHHLIAAPSSTKTSKTREAKIKARDKALTKHARVFRSSDGYEILVGRGARSNDEVTNRYARSNDLWLHAADYPGAHVVVRNHTRGEIPHRTIIEAAQLAALNSEAKDDARVAVNYTPRKFVSKSKGAAAGLVRLSSFKTVMVEPRASGERVM